MRALILIDLQNDFCKGGALEINGSEEIIPIANRLMPLFDIVVATQDWHPANHGSFAANHLWRKVGQVIDLDGLQQVLWSMHCVQNSFGAMFHNALNTEPASSSDRGVDKIIRKGTHQDVDSYSGFFDNGRRQQTELDDYLKSKEVNEVFIMGLATDYCVKFTALDAVLLGYKTYLIKDGSRGVNLNKDDVKRAIDEMRNNGVKVILSKSIK
jgi:nicotinamidase/pyrazinamidase